jgi:hypothetical protein
MKKLYILALILTSMMLGCKKDNKTSGGNNTQVNQSKDLDNYFTIDGETNYRYVDNLTYNVFCNNSLFSWGSGNPNIPSYLASIQFLEQGDITGTGNTNVSINISHTKNSVVTSYITYIKNTKIAKIVRTKVVNNTTQLEFDNIKIYKQEDFMKRDTTNPFYLSGKITCK